METQHITDNSGSNSHFRKEIDQGELKFDVAVEKENEIIFWVWKGVK